MGRVASSPATQSANPALAQRLEANRRGKLTRDQYDQIIGHLKKLHRLRWVGLGLVAGAPIVATVFILFGPNDEVMRFFALLMVVGGVGSGFRLILQALGNDRVRPILEQRRVEGREVEVVQRRFRGTLDRKTGKSIKYFGWTIPIAPGRYRIYFLQGTDNAISCETLEEQAGA